MHNESSRENVRLRGNKNVCWKDIMIYKSKDVPWRITMSTPGGSRVCCVLLWELNLVVDTVDIGENQKVGKPRHCHDYSV